MQVRANGVMERLMDSSLSLMPWFNCARSYGLSEKLKGKQHKVKDHSVENFLKQIKETNEELGEYIDLYQVHSATFDSCILTNTTVHNALNECKKERGWSIGLSVSGPSQDEIIREAMKIKADDGSRLPLLVLNEASESGMNIIIKEGLANGHALRHPKLREWTQKLDCEVDQIALTCILEQPLKARVLSGAITPEQLPSNLEAMEI
eukprot:scaffold53893_cov65-Attheya_sp.AAC.2